MHARELITIGISCEHVRAVRSYFMWKVPAAPKPPRTPKKAAKAGKAVAVASAAAVTADGAVANAVAAAVST